MLTHLDCTQCDKRYEPGRVYTVCSCGAPLYPRYDLARAALEMRPGHLALREPTMWRYREVLPLGDADVRVSLGEGFTPLLPAPRLGARAAPAPAADQGGGRNPTGSFKARGLAVAVSMAKALGATDVCLPSAGNAGSALAAYAAAAGLKAHVFLPRDIAKLFVMETEAYGAHVEMVDGLITDAGRVCAAKAKEHGWYECATLKEPYRVEGKKTMGYEIAEQLELDAARRDPLPDRRRHRPRGHVEGLRRDGDDGLRRARSGPRMFAVQAEGCAPIVKAFQEGREDAPLWEGATTHAHGLRVPKALGDFLILRGVRESRGAAIAVSEAEIVAGVKEAAAAEGLFMAPEGGACVAAARKLHANGSITPDDVVVLFDTGTGYKYVENMAPLWGALPYSRQACAAR